MSPRRQVARVPAATWFAMLVVVTAALHTVRGEIDQAHVVLLYLLVVLGGSVSGGRTLGLLLACSCSLLIDYYFQPPFDTLSVEKSLDWVVLLAFLAVAVTATHLLTRARAEAQAADRRAAEVQRLADIGAETLRSGRGDAAIIAVAKAVEAAVGVDACHILLPDSPAPARADRVVAEARQRLRPVAAQADGTTTELPYAADGVLAAFPIAMVRLALPLRSHAGLVGFLLLVRETGFRLDDAQRRFVQAVAHYAALVAERARLVAEADRAEALREANRMKDFLLASVSHDLRTPLTTIKALAQQGSRRGEANAAAIEAQADRLNHLVGDLLDLSRIKSGTLVLHVEVNTAEDLIGTVLGQLPPQHASRTVTTLDLAAPPLLGRFDLLQSVRALANLIDNALKFSPPDSVVEVTARQADDFLEIAVADRGAGVAPAEASRIFEAFYRPPQAPPDSGGAGLGLAIARQLAEAQDGSVTYDARAGRGSIFTLRLPASAAPPSLDGAPGTV